MSFRLLWSPTNSQCFSFSTCIQTCVKLNLIPGGHLRHWSPHWIIYMWLRQISTCWTGCLGSSAVLPVPSDTSSTIMSNSKSYGHALRQHTGLLRHLHTFLYITFNCLLLWSPQNISTIFFYSKTFVINVSFSVQTPFLILFVFV